MLQKNPALCALILHNVFHIFNKNLQIPTLHREDNGNKFVK